MHAIDKYHPNSKKFNEVNIDEDSISCMLFGGISKENNWRNELTAALLDFSFMDNADNRYSKELVLVNPYTTLELSEDIEDNLSMYSSFKWDHFNGSKTTIKSFYFSETGEQNMSLLELGYWLSYHLNNEPNNLNTFVISISTGYSLHNRLVTYLKAILGEDRYNIMVNDLANPSSHALAIYNAYKSLLTTY